MRHPSVPPHRSTLPEKYQFSVCGYPVLLPRLTFRVGDHWDPTTGVLSVGGLIDVSDTDVGAKYLATPVAQLEPPPLRLYLADEPHPWGGRWFFALVKDDDDELVLAGMRERDLEHPANHTGFWP